MELQLSHDMMQLLEAVAVEQSRDVEAIIQDALVQYLEAQRQSAAFDADIRRIIDEHRWLLDELAK